jgi:hypothetical protein
MGWGWADPADHSIDNWQTLNRSVCLLNPHKCLLLYSHFPKIKEWKHRIWSYKWNWYYLFSYTLFDAQTLHLKLSFKIDRILFQVCKALRYGMFILGDNNSKRVMIQKVVRDHLAT